MPSFDSQLLSEKKTLARGKVEASKNGQLRNVGNLLFSVIQCAYVVQHLPKKDFQPHWSRAARQ
jgi:hypothetical protein